MTIPSNTRESALELLRSLTGNPSAQFHDGQLEAISALVDERRRTLVVQRTGWGKSAVYMIAAMLLRRRGSGPAILVSPLIALMRDQVQAAQRAGVRAESISSANAHEWDEVLQRLDADDVDLLLVSPERLNNPQFRDERLPDLIRRTGLLVVDEAHCISDWGHDFRPDYRRIRELLAEMPGDLPVLATTATANARVVADVEEQLRVGGTPIQTIRGPLARRSLRLGVLTLADDRARLAWILNHIDDLPGSGIIYALTVSSAEDTARMLREAGHEVLAYTGRTDAGERERTEELLKQNQVKAVVATSALGMGFDKPDLGFVVHLGAPSSPVAYYQQVGRAGRATENADVLLLPGEQDRAIWHYFATASMPDEKAAQSVLATLSQASESVSTQALSARVDLRRSSLELLLKVLDVEGAVRRVTGGWVATGQEWTYDAPRYERIAAERAAEQKAMLAYESTQECRMAFLQHQLDDPNAQDCGRCDRCAGPWFPTDVSEDAAKRADDSLGRVGVPIEPRAMWPTGADRLGLPVKGRIPAEERADEGRVLARLTDLGWGSVLRRLLDDDPEDGPIPQNVLDACVRVLADWDWPERPQGILTLPSATRPQLVDSLADGLSRIGRLPRLGTIRAMQGTSGTTSGNSVFRLASVWDRFQIDEETHRALDQRRGGAVLLLADRVDTRWSVTVVSRMLKQIGIGTVLPFALAAQA